MSQKRRKLSQQLQAEAVQFVIQTGRLVVEVAQELGIDRARWVTG